ncbi:dipeptidase [Pseudoduganella lutea]|uniref:Dipeptidase n=1 Tax=Pseudoduganella lutea TaxID=321985 RepID=A0A4P6KW68_9BURK|nr:dipeptidase [Pseudoduganella lutea]QBE62702.1 dipeptidase [Pseudoduganella lutea]
MLKKAALVTLLAPLCSLCFHTAAPAAPGPVALAAAEHARTAYHEKVIDTLARMVSFNTVAQEGVPCERNAQHIAFKHYLRGEAERLGFDVDDAGCVLVIGYGKGSERVGIVTHGDVQPVDPAKWRQSPFTLDRTSEPGLLLGRGTEDDKGPIATALYAMKAISDRKVPLTKRIELYVYMAEESDWGPLETYLKTHVPPQVSITLDAEYPAVTAEKGWGLVTVTMPALKGTAVAGPALASFTGGFFNSQIPEDASATIDGATAELEQRIRARAAGQKGMRYGFSRAAQRLTVTAKGVSAHSSKPEDGVNAIAMLADALAVQPWAGTTAGAMVSFVNDLVGTGLYGEKFGDVAYRDAFMGPMTVAPVVLKASGGALELNLNLRRPRGKTGAELERQFHTAFDGWKRAHAPGATLKAQIGEPWVREDAPQVPVLLDVFAHYTGVRDAKPVSIGGGTNSRLFPNAVSFGPGMPGAVYTGHSEHEFITEKQLSLNLQMYTAVLVELAQ